MNWGIKEEKQETIRKGYHLYQTWNEMPNGRMNPQKTTFNNYQPYFNRPNLIGNPAKKENHETVRKESQIYQTLNEVPNGRLNPQKVFYNQHQPLINRTNFFSNPVKEEKQEPVKKESHFPQTLNEVPNGRVNPQNIAFHNPQSHFNGSNLFSNPMKEETQEPERKEPQRIQIPTELFSENVDLLKGIFNYLQPLIIWKEAAKQVKNNDKGPKVTNQPFNNEDLLEKKLYYIMTSTRNYLCHLCSLTDKKYLHLMHNNLINLYNIFGVDLEIKKKQLKLKTSNDDYFYYYLNFGVDFSNIKPEMINKVSRTEMNEKIKALIRNGNSKNEEKRENSQSLVLFGYLLHHLVGTRDTKKWSKVTEYFAGYEILQFEDERGNGACSSSQVNQALGNRNENKTKFRIVLQRKKDDDFERAAKGLIDHWAQMDERHNVKMIKSIFNCKPFVVWQESRKETRNGNSLLPVDIQKVLSSTSKFMSVSHDHINLELSHRIYLNLKHLCKAFRINFESEKKELQKLFETETVKELEKESCYYYFDCSNDIQNVEGKVIKKVSHSAVNNIIQNLIENKRDNNMNSDSESVNLLGFLLHFFEGTHNKKYFSNYYICKSDNEGGVIIRRNNERKTFEEDYKEFVDHLNNLRF